MKIPSQEKASQVFLHMEKHGETDWSPAFGRNRWHQVRPVMLRKGRRSKGHDETPEPFSMFL